MADINKRNSIRLPHYDYSRRGAYCVTICVLQKECLLGEIRHHQIIENSFGRIVEKEWHNLLFRFPTISIDEWIVMPNHIHGILWLHDGVGARFPRPVLCARFPRPSSARGGETMGATRGVETTPLHQPTLGTIVAYFKYRSTVAINQMRGMAGVRFWQRNYYERIIRNGIEMESIRQYIRDNPKH